MNINIINQYFNDNVVKLVSKKYNKAKLILAFNVFAHTSSVYDFINRVKKILDKDGYFIFEAQYLGYIYKRFILVHFFMNICLIIQLPTYIKCSRDLI